MRQQFIIFFLAFAVLFSNVHVSAPSHDHIEPAQTAAHDDHHDLADAAQENANDAPTDDAGVSTEIAHQHFTPAGLEVASLELNLAARSNRSMLAPTRVDRLASLNRAPPTEPPSA